MATDIATLGIQVTSEGVEQASERLRKLGTSAGNAQRATGRFMSELSQAYSYTSMFNREVSNSASALSSNVQQLRESTVASSALSDAIYGVTGRLIGLVAGYQAVAKAMDFARRGVQFNSSMEQSVIGIGSLITSMATLTDAQGRVLESQEKYNAAQVLAKELMGEIQILGLETTATTQELVGGVQSMMSSALAAGFTLKQIPQFAVAAAQAMQTMGLPLAQMRTELDALLTGRINASQDILAGRLFGDIKAQGRDVGAYIRKLQQTGELYDELMKRLEAFKLAGNDVANTLTGLLSNVDEALDVVAGKASKNLTESIKKSAKIFQELLFTSGDQRAEISKDFQNIASVMEQMYTIAGDGILASAETLADALRAVNSAVEGVDIAESMSQVLDILTSVAAGYVTMRVSAAAYNAVAQSGIVVMSKQIGKLGALQFALGSMTLQARAAGAALLAAFGGPVGASMFALGAAIGYLSTAETAAEKIARRHGDSLDMVSTSGDAAAKALEQYTDKLRSMSTTQAQMEVQKLTQELNNFISGRWFEAPIAGRIASSLRSFLPSASEVEDLQNLTKKLVPSNLSSMTAQELKKVKQEFAQFALERNKSLEFSSEGGAGELLDYLILLKTKLDLAQKGVQGVGEESATASTSVDDLTAAINLLNGTQDSNVGTLQGAIQFLQKYTRATDTAKKAAQENAQAQAAQALATMQAGIASAQASGKIEEAEQLRKAYEQMTVAVKEANETGSRRRGGGRSGLDQITRTEESLRKLRQEVQNLREIESHDARGYTALIMSIEQGRKSALADAEAQYKLTLARKSATQSQADQILALQKEKIELETVTKLRDAEKQKLQTTSDLHQRLAGLTYDWSIANEQKVALIHQEAEELRASNPELQQYIDLWERLASQDVTSEDAILSQRIQMLTKQKDAWSGMELGALTYYENSTNWTQNFSQLYTSTMDQLTDASINFAQGSTRAFEDMGRSFLNMLARMTMQAAISGLFNMGVSFVSEFFATGADTSAAGEALLRQGFARGGVLEGISSHSNSIVTHPTFFGYDRSITAFARGAGLMGEAGPEAIMPLTRTSSGKLGVRAETSSSQTTVNVNIQPPAGYDAQEDRRPNNQGGQDVMVSFIRSTVSSDMSTYGSTINRAMRSQGSRMPVMRGGG